MADQDGDAKTVAVAPDAPAGQDDIESKSNPDGPSRIWNLDTQDGFFVALAIGTAAIRLVRPPSGQAYAPLLEVFVAGKWKPVNAIVEVD